MSLTDARQKASALGFGTRRRLLPFGSTTIDEFDKKTLLWSFGGISVTERPTTICVHQVTMQTTETSITPIQIIETQDSTIQTTETNITPIQIMATENTPIQTLITIDKMSIPC